MGGTDPVKVFNPDISAAYLGWKLLTVATLGTLKEAQFDGQNGFFQSSSPCNPSYPLMH